MGEEPTDGSKPLEREGLVPQAPPPSRLTSFPVGGAFNLPRTLGPQDFKTLQLTLHILRSCWLMADRAEVAGLILPRPPAIATKARTIFGGHFDDRKLLQVNKGRK